MNKEIRIGNRLVGNNQPTFIIAEMSANHLMDYDRAVEIIKAAKESGADAVKLQTYTPETLTIDCDNEYFQIKQGTIWDGTTLYKLYQTAYTPWEWQSNLKKIADELGIVCFSSPFDFSAIDFLEEIDVPAYKVASFEITDIPFIRKIAKLKKPIIMSTGIAKLEDIERALEVCKEEGNEDVILLKCTSAYPAPYEDVNLNVIPNMKETFNCVVGISDHTLGSTVPVGSIGLGSRVIEKHFTLSREDGGPDAVFSMEPNEFKEMVNSVRIIEKALGRATYELSEKQKKSREHARSLFIVEDIEEGEQFTSENVRSIRPGYGLHTMYYEDILGKKARKTLKKGTPLSWEHIK